MSIRRSKTKSLAMKKADDYFSQFIRLSHANHGGYCQCVTCGNMKHWKDIQCGHWRRRGLQPTRYDERNCAPQCVRCNKWRSGEPERFEEYLRLKHGDSIVEKLRLISLVRQKRTQNDFENIASEYQLKLKELMEAI